MRKVQICSTLRACALSVALMSASAACVAPDGTVIDNVVTDGTFFLVDNTARITGAPPTQDTTVCDPFANNPSHPGANLNLGILGKLTYLNDSQPRYSSAKDYVSYGQTVPVNLFVDTLNIPTRAFDLGFTTQAGQVITNQYGNTLYEYFGLQFESEITLGAGDAPGAYQFAILSDDGSVLELDQGSGMGVVVDNDGTHATRLGCATAPVTLAAGKKIPMRLSYYQGPRYHVALMLLWRPWTGGAFNPNDSACGMSGNSTFFNSNTVPSTPQSTYNNMLARGWKVLKADNYLLPRQVTENPCVAPEAVKTFITKFTPTGSLTRLADVEFEFASNRAGSSFECRLDDTSWSPCTTPHQYLALADGAHTFDVRAIAPNGDRDLIGASYSWRIDRLPPALTFISTNNTSTTIQVDWVTSEPATSAFKWGLTTATPNVLAEDMTLKTTHQVLLQGLTPSTVHYFFIGGRDEAGNSFWSNRFSTQTKSAPVSVQFVP